MNNNVYEFDGRNPMFPTTWERLPAMLTKQIYKVGSCLHIPKVRSQALFSESRLEEPARFWLKVTIGCPFFSHNSRPLSVV